MNQAEKLRLLYRVTRYAERELEAVFTTIESDPFYYEEIYTEVHEIWARLRVTLARADGQLPMPMEATG